MSDHSLPDEIISEILSPALKVSDEVFSDTSRVSPFSKYSESTSAYLLVCKSWLRVATPLLYNVVILRSKAQAKALSLALAGNKMLGKFIKKLRVEGGYGAPMLTILQCSPNISDLFVSLEIYSSDNTNGLCKGLQLLNPTRLILWDLSFRPLENKMVSQLVDALAKSISQWDRLSVFDCPFAATTNRAKKVISPLIRSKRLQALAISFVSTSSWAYDTFKECPLKVIQAKQPVQEWERTHYLPRLKNDPKLMALLKFTDTITRSLDELERGHLEPALELPLIAPSLNPSFTPLAGAPEDVHDKIWARVLHFAMSVPELANDVKWKDIPRRVPLLLRLGLPSYYAHVMLRRSSAAPSFASALSRNPSLGPHVRSLGIQYWSSIDHEFGTNPMLAILLRTSGLLRFGGNKDLANDTFSADEEGPISWNAFEAMAQCSGSTLRECFARIHTYQVASANIFAGLTALRTLIWNSSTTFLEVPNASGHGLPSLEKLWISSASTSFMTVLSRMKLPSLRRVILSCDSPSSEIFLETHGPKLTELHVSSYFLSIMESRVLKLCPNLRSFSILGYRPPDADDLYLSEPITSLVKMIFEASYVRRNMAKNEIAEWEQFFTELNTESLPNLREIWVENCEWPTTERDIAKSGWVRCAEMMIKRNINLVDRTGTKWRSRLQVK
ncbi:hypothetical protein DFH08DRAFT_1083415 [Mycena albidolilacea]|uniref:Uncharacterized protein n=1 Tax=Mycena albidolilacea TaxID=1033008 RepID=A0AAD7EKS3_9AGAR|nr:hypothetical protein DFH08DRAFT_1083415 [Mycena albidolilacea]